MEKITRFDGQMAPLARANVDTDQIMPKQFLKRVERSGFGQFLFYDWARDAEGEMDPTFILNRPEYADATILVTGPNFGSGSSREHAPWGLQDWGFRAIIAPSFADIFYTNCLKIGVLPVVVAEDAVVALTKAAEDPSNVATVDLVEQKVSVGDLEVSFTIDAFARHCLLEGLDHVGLTLAHTADIDAYEVARPRFKPSVA